jgi:uncharacterized protein (DUF2267 family)
MTYDEFIGQVHHRARLGTTGDAVRATRATLEVLGERLFGGEAKDLAAQLPLVWTSSIDASANTRGLICR